MKTGHKEVEQLITITTAMSGHPYPWHEQLSVQNAIKLIVKAKLVRKWRKTGNFVDMEWVSISIPKSKRIIIKSSDEQLAFSRGLTEIARVL